MKIRLPVGNWNLLHVIAAIVVMGLATMVPTWLMPVAESAGISSASAGQWMELVKFAFFVLFSIVAVAVVGRRWPARTEFGLGAWDKRNTVIMAVLGFVLYEVAVWIFEKNTPGAREASTQVRDSLGIGKTLSTDLAVILMVTVGAPVGEEFLCRGLLFRSLRDAVARTLPSLPQWLPIAVGILGSAYFFMTMHGGDGQDLQLYMIGLMGVLAALAYVITGSLRAAVLIHGLNNAFSVMGLAPYFLHPKLAWTLALVSPLICLALLDGIAALMRKEINAT